MSKQLDSWQLSMASQLAAALALMHDEGDNSSDDDGNRDPPHAPAHRSWTHLHMMRKSTPARIFCGEDWDNIRQRFQIHSDPVYSIKIIHQ